MNACALGARRWPHGLRVAIAALALAGVSACAGDRAPDDGAARSAPRSADPALHTADASAPKAQAHAAIAQRLRGFPIERGPPPRSPRAADDERFRLGAFWQARSDTHHFGPDFEARAGTALALPGDTRSDAALRALLDTVDARLPAWQSLVDYNASGRMRDDGGDGGRKRLPGAIAALDAIESAVWTYLDTVDAEFRASGDPPP